MSAISIALLVGLALLIPTGYAAYIGAPYAPTRLPVVRKAFKLLGLDASDVLVDLGAGDGSILIEASQHGAKAIGYELSPIMLAIILFRTFANKKNKIKFSNFYKSKLPEETTIVFAFLMPNNMSKVLKYLQQQKLPKAKYFLAYAFPLPEQIEPIQIIHAKNCARLFVYDLRSILKTT